MPLFWPWIASSFAFLESMLWILRLFSSLIYSQSGVTNAAGGVGRGPALTPSRKHFDRGRLTARGTKLGFDALPWLASPNWCRCQLRHPSGSWPGPTVINHSESYRSPAVYLSLPPVLSPLSSKLTGSGGRGSTTTASKSWSRPTRRVAAPEPSPPRTTWPRRPAGPSSAAAREASTPRTLASSGRTRPKTSRAADAEEPRTPCTTLPSRIGRLLGANSFFFFLLRKPLSDSRHSAWARCRHEHKTLI